MARNQPSEGGAALFSARSMNDIHPIGHSGRASVALDDLRRFTVARNFPAPATLKRTLHRLGFVQADPIRAPARAQDLTLRHRVTNYRAGDLERQYARLGIEEDFFIVYGFVTKAIHALMHPRVDACDPGAGPTPWPPGRKRRAAMLLDFVRERGEAHPREVDGHFGHGRARNYWGGSSKATTQLLGVMHYRGLLRVSRRDSGIRVYAAQEQAPDPVDAAERRARVDALVDAAVRLYAPLPGPSLSYIVRRLQYAVPQWKRELRPAIARARERLAQVTIDGVAWYWPADEDPLQSDSQDTVRLLAPFDPLVWDRDRLEMLWDWVYRFEAYTPAPKRKLGYYALPLLWRDRVIGWGNLAVKGGALDAEIGYVGSAPRDRAYRRELEAELERMRVFLGL